MVHAAIQNFVDEYVHLYYGWYETQQIKKALIVNIIKR
jgi:hypothetical protein